jgi:DNA primase
MAPLQLPSDEKSLNQIFPNIPNSKFDINQSSIIELMPRVVQSNPKPKRNKSNQIKSSKTIDKNFSVIKDSERVIKEVLQMRENIGSSDTGLNIGSEKILKSIRKSREEFNSRSRSEVGGESREGGPPSPEHDFGSSSESDSGKAPSLDQIEPNLRGNNGKYYKTVTQMKLEIIKEEMDKEEFADDYRSRP